MNMTVLEIIQRLDRFFEGDLVKVHAWLHCKNPNLGGIKPMSFIISGREKKLLKIMIEWQDGVMA